MMIRKVHLAALSLLACVAISAPSMAEETEADDEMFTEGVRDFG